MLFGESPREWAGTSLETVQTLETFARLCSGIAERKREQSRRYYTYAISAEGLIRSLDELEQSCYAARRYAMLIRETRIDELSPEDRLNYSRHVYFDKNAYIRIFAVLDKLGTLLNQLLNLRTERMKSRYSYFTMLRNLREHGLHSRLMKPLNDFKERHQGAMSRLRNRRNLEIHQMNAELKDDLHQSIANNGDSKRLEDLAANMADLEQGWEMVLGSLRVSARYACEYLRKME
ncbi:Cthe_2314 family HEPN domain-containing protein [Cohnella boryungensis]|uniref:Cthe_2314 family HEPN domain-containing protein n=1 Tax=Cohnella boryungensis TaxID=768479 RepID=A0ABV8S957_9BACL